MGLTIDVEQANGQYVITAAGEVDLSTSPDLRAAILKGVKNDEDLNIDLAGVEYMDSSGVATLVEGLKSCTAKQKSFSLIRPSEPVMKVLQLARLNTLFKIKETVDTN